MFRIGKLFHLTHVVDDLDAVDAWYDDVFSVKRFYKGYEKLAGRDASLLCIGDVIMEPMMPAKRENLRNLSVKKFHDRFGQHFHSIAWYVDDVEDISARLDQEKLRLFNIVGALSSGWLAGRFGSRNVMIWRVLGSTAATLMCVIKASRIGSRRSSLSRSNRTEPTSPSTSTAFNSGSVSATAKSPSAAKTHGPSSRCRSSTSSLFSKSNSALLRRRSSS